MGRWRPPGWTSGFRTSSFSLAESDGRSGSAEGPHEILFASTKDALELAETYAGLKLRKREVPEGSLLTVVEGRAVKTEAFEPDRSFREADALPSVRAPDERVSCLRRLATIAAAATHG